MNTLLEVDSLDVGYRNKHNAIFSVLRGVSIEVKSGETLGLVGESGSGKSTLGRAILGLAPVTSGSIRLHGEEISGITRKKRRSLANQLQVIFQDPYSSLNPALTIGQTLAEPLIAHGVPAREAKQRIVHLLEQVSLPHDAVHRRPSAFSGGQRQRVAIARAMALDPKLIICDEPVSALDLSTQARVLDLLLEVQQKTGVAYLFISHDLDVVRHISHRVAVMLRGEIVEQGLAEQVTTTPQHSYTQRLMLASPLADPVLQRERRAQRLALK